MNVRMRLNLRRRKLGSGQETLLEASALLQRPPLPPTPLVRAGPLRVPLSWCPRAVVRRYLWRLCKGWRRSRCRHIQPVSPRPRLPPEVHHAKTKALMWVRHGEKL